MSTLAQVYAFEGEITQFLPGKRACFVTLSHPIGEITRALLNISTIKSTKYNTTDFRIRDHVSGKLVVGDASVAEVVELNS